MKKIDLSILDNADDDIVEKLLPYSSDSDTKDRVFSMSEKKFDELMNNNSSETDDFAASVGGVDRYHRPVWHKVLCAAAAFALIAGGIGTAIVLKPKMAAPSEAPAATQTGTAQLTTAAVTDVTTAYTMQPVTETLAAAVTESELTTTAAVTTSAPEETQPVSTDTADSRLSEDEMRSMFEEYSKVYIEANKHFLYNKIDPNSDKVTFWMHIGDAPDQSYDIDDPDENVKKEGNSYYRGFTYYRLDEPHFDSYQDYIDHYASYLEPYYNNDKLPVTSDLSSYAPDSVISENLIFYSIWYNGAVYSMRDTSRFDPDCWKEIISDRSYYATPYSFMWERVYKATNEYGDYASTICLCFEKMSDGRWRAVRSSIGDGDLKIQPDFHSLDIPYNKGSFEPSDDMGIDFEKAIQEANKYVYNTGENHGFKTGYEFNSNQNFAIWHPTDTLPESYTHITDDYVKDGKYMRFLFYGIGKHDGPDVEVYTDRTGKVFALVD